MNDTFHSFQKVSTQPGQGHLSYLNVDWMAPHPTPQDKFVVATAEDYFTLVADRDGVIWCRDDEEPTQGGFFRIAENMEDLLLQLMRQSMGDGPDAFVSGFIRKQKERLSSLRLSELDAQSSDYDEVDAPESDEAVRLLSCRLRCTWACTVDDGRVVDVRDGMSLDALGALERTGVVAFLGNDDVVRVVVRDVDGERLFFVHQNYAEIAGLG